MEGSLSARKREYETSEINETNERRSFFVCFVYFACFVFSLQLATYGGIDPRIQSPSALSCRIDQISPQSRSLKVSCRVSDLPAGRLSLRFLDRFAGVSRLDERVFALKVLNERGVALPLEIKGDGLYLFTNDGQSRQATIDYEMRLARVLDPSQYALTSSLGADAAVLMLNDQLPSLCVDGGERCQTVPVKLQIGPPADWKIATVEKAGGAFYEVDDPHRAIFFLGNFRERSMKTKGMNITVLVAGAWSFSDEELFHLAEGIAREQASMVESAEKGNFLVTIAPFPLPLTGLRSSGVTIGRTVVLQLNANNNPAKSYAHLRRHLAHEMFHFYLPNAFRIRENFDWFWEGFTRYTALLTLTRLKLIGLDEYLDAIGEEYEAYAYNPLRTRLSLLEASPEKFANYSNYDLVYRKGMLVAALYDLESRTQSRGKYSVADVIRALYQNYARKDLAVGNREVLIELRRPGNFDRIVRDDIEGIREIDLVERVKNYGLVVDWGPATGGKVRIGKSAKLSVKQKMLFDQLMGDGK